MDPHELPQLTHMPTATPYRLDNVLLAAEEETEVISPRKLDRKLSDEVLDLEDFVWRDLQSEMNVNSPKSSWIASALRSGDLSESHLEHVSNQITKEASSLRIQCFQVFLVDLVPFISTTKPKCMPWFGFLSRIFAKKKITTGNRTVALAIDLVPKPFDASVHPEDLPHTVKTLWQSPPADNPSEPLWKVEDSEILHRRPKTSLFNADFTMDQVLHCNLLLKVFDKRSKAVLSFAIFDLFHIFECALGSPSLPFIRPLVLSRDLYRSMIRDQEVEDDFNSENLYREEGTCQIRVCALGDRFIEDLLVLPDPLYIQRGLCLLLRLVQFSDLNQVDPAHPLKKFLDPQCFQSLFSCIEIVSRKSPQQSLETLRTVSMVLATGISRFGHLFASSLEPFGEEIGCLCDCKRFGEDLVTGLMEILRVSPLITMIESMVHSKWVLLKSLLMLLEVQRMEDVQVRALSFINLFIRSVQSSPSVLNRFLDRFMEGHRVQDYIVDQLASWHPQIAEETLKLFHFLFKSRRMGMSDEIRDTLRSIETDNQRGKLAKMAQDIVLEDGFGITEISLTVLQSTCPNRRIYPLSNLVSAKKVFRSPKGFTGHLDFILRYEEGCQVSHLGVSVPRECKGFTVMIEFMRDAILPIEFGSQVEELKVDCEYAEIVFKRVSDLPLIGLRFVPEVKGCEIEVDCVKAWGAVKGVEYERDLEELIGRVGSNSIC